VVAWGLWALVMLGLAVAVWLDHLLRQAGRPELVTLDIGVLTVLGEVSAATVGALLASRRPRHPVGWLLLALGLSLAMDGVSLGYANYGLVARPGVLPAADYAAAYTNGFGFIEAALLGFVLLLTPTGSLPSRRWRWWARVAAAAPAVGLVTAVPLPFDMPLGAVPNPLAVASLADQLQVASGVRHPLATLGLGGFAEGAVAVGDVGGLVVKLPADEAMPQDLQPAVAERSQGGVVGLAAGALGVVELPRPARAAQAAEGPLLDGVGQVAVAGQPGGHDQLASA
jgi:hypothetical protein